MKRIRYPILVILSLLLLIGCSQKQVSETDMSPYDITEAITKSQTGLPAMQRVMLKDKNFPVWMSDYYSIQMENLEDGVICYADGVQASEIAVLQMKDQKDCKDAEAAFKVYIQNRTNVFEGYAPQQAAIAKEGVAVVNGRYIALIICPEPKAAKEAFLSCFGENEETEERKDSYNSEAVLQAWRSGDDSTLSDINRSILDAAKGAIESEIDNDMSDYEKELAIHDFITGWSRFDYSIFGRSAAEEFTDGSDTPYGVLINQSAMCHGYSSTFQLFMDMLDIECITVFGIPGGSGVEHSWNMVKLDGEWYCVDCAWDDPIGGNPSHTYFNVTSDTLRSGSIHQWDENSVPEANGTVYAYGKHE